MANRRTEPDRRPTKAERREEARLQRAEIQRKMARRKRNRTLIVGVLIGAIAVGVAVVAFEKNKGVTTANGTHVDSPEQLLAQATTAAKTAGCSDVRTTEPFNPDNRTGTVPLPPEADIDRDHIGTTYDPTPPPLSAYASTPPASGPHDPTPLAAGVYDSPPSIYATIHSLEHAAAIIWYDPKQTGQALDELKAFYQEQIAKGGKIIVAPYTYPSDGDSGELPKNVAMALVSWHRLETCAQVSLPAAFGFSSKYAYPPYQGQTYLGEAPEPTGAIG